MGTVSRRASRGQGCCIIPTEEQVELIGPSHTTISSTASWSETGDGPHTTPDLPHVILLEFPLQLPSVAILSLFDLDLDLDICFILCLNHKAMVVAVTVILAMVHIVVRCCS